jgi:DNA-binding NarL/FixJ family response regulator
VRVVGHSWRDDEETARSMLEAGAIAYVSKGSNVSLLLDMIRQAAGDGQGEPEGPLRTEPA